MFWGCNKGLNSTQYKQLIDLGLPTEQFRDTNVKLMLSLLEMLKFRSYICKNVYMIYIYLHANIAFHGNRFTLLNEV